MLGTQTRPSGRPEDAIGIPKTSGGLLFACGALHKPQPVAALWIGLQRSTVKLTFCAQDSVSFGRHQPLQRTPSALSNVYERTTTTLIMLQGSAEACENRLPRRSTLRLHVQASRAISRRGFLVPGPGRIAGAARAALTVHSSTHKQTAVALRDGASASKVRSAAPRGPARRVCVVCRVGQHDTRCAALASVVTSRLLLTSLCAAPKRSRSSSEASK